jgi:membrane protein implicated in regulation of membrane protease activity
MSELLIGCRGTVTVPTRGANGAGEVLVSFGGGSETFLAYSEEPLRQGTAVVVYEVRGGRRVLVTPLDPQEPHDNTEETDR